LGTFKEDPDLDPAFHFNADPDPTFHFNADPDPAPHQSAAIFPDFFLNKKDNVGAKGSS
jgi:hypothetical protein